MSLEGKSGTSKSLGVFLWVFRSRFSYDTEINGNRWLPVRKKFNQTSTVNELTNLGTVQSLKLTMSPWKSTVCLVDIWK